MGSTTTDMGQKHGRWFAVRTQPRKERLALEHLARQGFEGFCPMWRGAGRPRRRRPSLAPLFPSYVFASLDLERQRWRSINGTIACVGLVSFGSRPAPLPAGFVEAMRRASSGNGEVEFTQDLAPGSYVRVVGGTFDNMCGTLLGKKGPERVAILLEVLGQATRVEMLSTRLVAA
jgi:transcriptional antiterminator RfaH